MKKIMLLLTLTLLLGANESYYEKGELVELKKILQSRSTDSTGIEYFQKSNGQKVGITDEILVKCNAGIDCERLLAQFSQTNISKLTDTIFVVKVEDYDDIFSLSRELFKSGDVEFAHPNFIKERKLR